MTEPGSIKLLIWNSNGDLSAVVQDSRQAGVQVTRIPISGFAVGVYLYRVDFQYDSGAKASTALQKFSVLR
jgi:hypothetical protein